MVAFLEASLPDAKELQAALGDAEIDVELFKGGGCGTGCGCGSKVALLAHRDDMPRVAAFLNQRWRALVEAEGTVSTGEERNGDDGAARASGADGEACPACSTPIADNASACSDCGLVWG